MGHINLPGGFSWVPQRGTWADFGERVKEGLCFLPLALSL